jgi:hypothetical protein
VKYPKGSVMMSSVPGPVVIGGKRTAQGRSKNFILTIRRCGARVKGGRFYSFVILENIIVRSASSSRLNRAAPPFVVVWPQACACLTRIIRQTAKDLVAQAFQPVPKTLCFSGLLILLLYVSMLSHFSKSSWIKRPERP